MSQTCHPPTTGLLFSGGIDSAILLEQLLVEGRRVQPIYVACGLRWESAELAAARRYLAAVDAPGIGPLVELSAPLAPLIGEHWGVELATAANSVPGADSADAEVFLPGRNLLLIAPAAIWCQTRGIAELAIGTLAANPFADATGAFLRQMEHLLCLSHGQSIRLRQPLAECSKSEIIGRYRGLPLELTFSCLNPVEGRHCGQCNKCGERRSAFEAAGVEDRGATLDPRREEISHSVETW